MKLPIIKILWTYALYGKQRKILLTSIFVMFTVLCECELLMYTSELIGSLAGTGVGSTLVLMPEVLLYLGPRYTKYSGALLLIALSLSLTYVSI